MAGMFLGNVPWIMYGYSSSVIACMGIVIEAIEWPWFARIFQSFKKEEEVEDDTWIRVYRFLESLETRSR